MNGREEFVQMDEDAQVTGGLGALPFVPKLRKNRRLETRWGVKYMQAVKETVFTLRPAPYMPTEAPPSLGEEAGDSQPLYVCKQCRDCFRFLSSLEDHNARRSWILGYWCQNCFLKNCPHKPNDEPACVNCQEQDGQKKHSLRAKRKGRKVGCTKIFYNQCQFFAHLKSHQTSVVDLGDVMLMPLPVDIETEQYTELEQVCEFIMEHMFITRTHIVDWLQTMQFGNKWWTEVQPFSSNNESSTSDVVAAVQSFQNGKVSKCIPSSTADVGSSLPSTTTDNTVSVGTNQSPNIMAASESFVIDTNRSIGSQIRPGIRNMNKIRSTPAVTSIDPLEPLEDDDNPCTTTDIAFVDCGPSAKIYPSETSLLVTPISNHAVNTNADSSIDSFTDSLPSVIAMPFKVIDSTNLKQTSAKNPVTNVVYAAPSTITSAASSSTFTPKITVKKFANERSKSPPPISLWKDFSRVYKETKKQTLKRVPPRPNIQVANCISSPSTPPKTENQTGTSKPTLIVQKTNLQGSASKTNPRVLTVHSPKNADISTIISQLPPEVINGKKIVFIGQDSERFTILPKCDGFSNPGMIQIKSEPGQAKIIKTVPFKVTPSLISSINQQNGKNVLGSTVQKIFTDPVGSEFQQVSLDGKIIYQNGRKFIIRHTPKPISSNNLKVVNNPSKFRVLTKPNTTAAPINTSTGKLLLPPLTPSPSASEHSNSSNCDAHRKQDSVFEKNEEQPPIPILPSEFHTTVLKPLYTHGLCTDMNPNAIEHLWIETDAAGRFYFNTSNAKPSKATKAQSWPHVAAKYKQQMFDNLLHLSKREIKKRLDHLKIVNSDYSKMMSVTSDERILGNLEAMRYLEIALEEPSLWNNDEQQSDQESEDEDFNNREVSHPQTEDSLKCQTCDKPIKPESHVVGLSKLSEQRLIHCNCSNYVCHICNVFQGNMTRFNAHLNFHAKKEPFSCPECFKKFLSFRRLETHTWTTCFHPLTRRWFICKICQVEGFIDMESLTRHFAITHSESKIACPECRIFLKSRDALQKHQAAAHPTKTDILEPVNLIVCDLGHCVIRPENFREHMDDHLGVLRMLYYKCPFCAFIVKETDKGKEQIKSHLYTSHSERIPELVSRESLCDIMLAKQIGRMKKQFHLEHIGENAVSIHSEHGEGYSRNIVESEQDQEMVVPKIISTRTITPEVFEQTSQEPPKSSSDYLNATLTKQTLKDGVECSFWSINLENSGLPQMMDVRSEASKLPIVQDSVDISNESSAPEIRKLPDILDATLVVPNGPMEVSETIENSTSIILSGSRAMPETEQREATKRVLCKMKEVPETTEQRHTSGENWNGKREFSEKIVEMPKKPAEIKKSTVLSRTTEKIIDNPIETTGAMRQTHKETLAITRENQVESIREKTDTEAGLSETTTSSTIPTTFSTETSTNLSGQWTQTTQPLKLIEKLSVKSLQTSEKSLTDSDHAVKEDTRNKDGIGETKPLETAEQVLTESVETMVGNESNEYLIDSTASEVDATSSTPTVNCAPNFHKNHSGMPQIIVLQPKDGSQKTNLSMMRSILKPPPLARIPQHLLDASKMKEKTEESKDQISVKPIQPVIKRRRRRRRPWRIALNGPICYTEACDYCCHLCGELINTAWPVVRSHFSSRHSRDYKLSILTPRLLRMSDEFINGGYREVLATRKRRPEAVGSGTKKRRRWNPRKKNLEKHPQGPLGEGLYVKPQSVQDDDGNFICKKCDHSCGDMKELRDHIATTHRIKDHYLVCLECGENFVVAPSLQMHLKAFHGIENPIIYMTQNTAYAPEVTEGGESESKTGIANQCDVCMAVFEDKAAVDKHLRVHGMAFLKRKRIEARIASISPEKKPRLESAAGNSVDNSGKNGKLENGADDITTITNGNAATKLDQSLISDDKST